MTKRVSIVSISERIQTPVSKPKGTFFFYSLYLSARFIYKYHVIELSSRIKYVIFGYNFGNNTLETSLRRQRYKYKIFSIIRSFEEIKPDENCDKSRLSIEYKFDLSRLVQRSVTFALVYKIAFLTCFLPLPRAIISSTFINGFSSHPFRTISFFEIKRSFIVIF